jgi:cytoskeletal protein CcmA (bactofilin family)
MRWNAALSAFSIATAAIMFSNFAAAQKSADRVQIGSSILVEPDEKAGDLVCVACSIRVRGRTAGDVVAVAGSVTVESGAQIAGDTVAIAGHVRLESGARIGGDVTTVGGRLYRAPEALIGGDVTTMSGAGWSLLIFVVPLLILGGIVALIIWLIQRNRRPPQVPAYPNATPSIRS